MSLHGFLMVLPDYGVPWSFLPHIIIGPEPDSAITSDIAVRQAETLFFGLILSYRCPFMPGSL